MVKEKNIDNNDDKKDMFRVKDSDFNDIHNCKEKKTQENENK